MLPRYCTDIQPRQMDFWRIFGYSRISFHHHPDTINLPTKDGKLTNLLELCKTATPPCRLNPVLFNGHLQTFWTATKYQDIPIYYKRKIFEAEDTAFAGTFAVDFVVAPCKEDDDSLPPRTTYFEDAEFGEIGSLDSKPMLVTLHGLKWWLSRNLLTACSGTHDEGRLGSMRGQL